MKRTVQPYTVEGLSRRLDEMQRQIADINRRLGGSGEGRRSNESVTWYMHTLDTVEWGGWYAASHQRVSYFVVSLLTAGTTTTTCHLNIDGVSVGSVSLTSGETFGKTRIASEVYTDDGILSAEVTAVGTDAEGLTATARFG